MLIVGNWKAYVETPEEAKKLVATAKRMALRTRTKIVLAPPAPLLALIAGGKRSKIAFAGQDVSDTLAGASTGEVSAPALKAAGASYVIIGHSERRARGETDALIAEKAKRAVANGLIPILCVGESERDTDARYLSVIRSQLAAVFDALLPRDRLAVIVAYEPVWAIGKRSDEAIRSTDLAEMVLYIRKVLADYLPGKNASKAKVIYGGSVDSTNARELAGGSGVDGFLPGRASTDTSTLSALIKAVS